MLKKILIIIVAIFIILAGIFAINTFSNDTQELKTIKSDKELLKIFSGEN